MIIPTNKFLPLTTSHAIKKFELDANGFEISKNKRII